jgi:nicotinate phosphoribosyltransferase
VQVEDRLAAKRGKFSGKKQVYRCRECLRDLIVPWDAEVPECHGLMEPLLTPLVENGTIVQESKSPQEYRDYVMKQVEILDLWE